MAAFGAALIRKLHEGGIVACGKHFPVTAIDSTDSHFELPLVDASAGSASRAIEYVPFREGIVAGLAAISCAVMIPSLDRDRAGHSVSQNRSECVLKGRWVSTECCSVMTWNEGIGSHLAAAGSERCGA